MKASVFDGPCIPQPTMPMVMRSEAALRFGSAAVAQLVRIVGAASAARLVAAKKERRVNCFECECSLMRGHDARNGVGIREKFFLSQGGVMPPILTAYCYRSGIGGAALPDMDLMRQRVLDCGCGPIPQEPTNPEERPRAVRGPAPHRRLHCTMGGAALNRTLQAYA